MQDLNYEDHAAIYAAALVYACCLLAGALAGVGAKAAQTCRLGFATLIAGLMVAPKGPTLTRIAGWFGLQSHDTLRRALLDETWRPATLLVALVNSLRPLFGVWPGPGYLILDDVLLPKPFSRRLESAYYLHDYVRGRKQWCLCLVVLAWSNGVITIPLGFVLWPQKGSPYLTARGWAYQDKRALAKGLILQARALRIPFDSLVFDSWYASRGFLSWLHREQEIRFVTAVCCTMNLRWLIDATDRHRLRTGGRSPQYLTEACRDLVPRISLPYFSPYETLGLRAKAGPVNLRSVSEPGQADLTLVIIPNYRKKRKDWAQKEPKAFRHPHKYLLTNIPGWSVRQIIEGYQSRWAIEVLFRNLKQHLGLGACQARLVAPTERHLALCFVACTALAVLREELRPHWNEAREPLTIGAVKRFLQQQALTLTPEGRVTLQSRLPLPRAAMEAIGEAASQASLTDLLTGQFACTLPPEAGA